LRKLPGVERVGTRAQRGRKIKNDVRYLKWRNGRKVESVQEVKGSPGAVVIKLEGTGHTLQIGKDVFRLAQNADILEAVEGTLAPIKEHKQARAIEFRQDDKPVSAYQ
jgi:hypothetical protein